MTTVERADATLAQAAKASGWWWPMRGAVILTERPRLLERDDDGRLHGSAAAGG